MYFSSCYSQVLMMKSSKKIVCIFLLTFLLLNIAGCVQSDDQDVNGIDVVGQSDEQNTSVLEDVPGLSSQKEATMSLVSDAVELIDAEGELSFDEFRKNGSEWFHDDSYIFVWQTDGLRVVYPPDVSGEGKDMSGLVDVNDKPIGSIFIETALSEAGGGWVDYQWTRPGEDAPSLKYTYIMKASIDDQTYLVGSGFYVDDHVYTNDLESIEYFTRFDTISLGNVLHPEMVDRDLGIDYSIAHVILKPGASLESHLMKNPEAHYVLAGEGILYIEDVPFELSEGKLVLVPANSRQHTENTGDVDLEFLAIDQPAWAQENEEMVD